MLFSAACKTKLSCMNPNYSLLLSPSPSPSHSPSFSFSPSRRARCSKSKGSCAVAISRRRSVTTSRGRTITWVSNAFVLRYLYRWVELKEMNKRNTAPPFVHRIFTHTISLTLLHHTDLSYLAIPLYESVLSLPMQVRKCCSRH
jgi:hypothetical protein